MEPFTSGETAPYEPGKEDLIRKVFRYNSSVMRFDFESTEYLWYDPSGYVTSGPY